MGKWNDIDQLEHDIWILKGQLLTLRRQLSEPQKGIEKDRLDKLEQDLLEMQQEIKRMNKAFTEPSSERFVSNSFNPLDSSGSSTTVNPANTSNSNDASDSSNIPNFSDTSNPNNVPNSSHSSSFTPPPFTRPKAKQPFDFEKTFGTGIMGVIASVLVFISILIFGSLLIPFLSEGVKIFLMFFVSFALAGTGIFLLHREETNRFSLSLCACGVTAIAVSLFVTRIFFGITNDVVFFCLISVWMAMTAYLCRRYHVLFRIIGETGILIACLFGITELLFSAEWYFYLIIACVYGISSLVFHYAKPRESYEKNAFSHIGHTIALIAFSFPITVWSLGFSPARLWLLCAFFFLLALFELLIVWTERVDHGVLFYFLSLIQMIVLAVTLSRACPIRSSGFFMLFSLFLLWLFSRKQTKQDTIGDLCVLFLYLVGAGNLSENQICCSLLCVLPPFLYGHKKQKKVFLYGGLIGMTGLFTIPDTTLLSFLLMALVPFLLFLFLARKENDGMFSSIGYGWMLFAVSHGLVALCSGYSFSHSESRILAFLVLALSHLLITKGDLLKETSKAFETTSFLITGIFMSTSLFLLYQDYLTFFVVLVSVGLFVSNSRKLLGISEGFGYYIAVKYTVLMLVILDVSWDLAIVYSICMLLFSLFSILAGFLYGHKSFRIYGLLLSMISVFKLVLFDGKGKSTAYNALGFLICGAICFGISFVYNKIEQRLDKKG